jgi:hypothetical protein
VPSPSAREIEMGPATAGSGSGEPLSYYLCANCTSYYVENNLPLEKHR